MWLFDHIIRIIFDQKILNVSFKKVDNPARFYNNMCNFTDIFAVTFAMRAYIRHFYGAQLYLRLFYSPLHLLHALPLIPSLPLSFLLFSFPLISHSLLFLPPCHFDFPIHWPVLSVCVSVRVCKWEQERQTVQICLYSQTAVVFVVYTYDINYAQLICINCRLHLSKPESDWFYEFLIIYYHVMSHL